MSDISVTQILKRLRDGASDDDRQAAAEQLYQRYRHRVEQIARGRLSPSGGLSDEEDVAQSAFRSFFGRIETGKLDALVSGGQAWAILARLTRNKAIDSVRYENAICRGGEGSRRSAAKTSPEQGAGEAASDEKTASQGAKTGEPPTDSSRADESHWRRQQRRRNTPEEMPVDLVRDSGQRAADEEAVSNEMMERFLEELSEATLRGIVALKLEGFTNEEIAEKLGCATRTIERKLNLIRRLWVPILEDSCERSGP